MSSVYRISSVRAYVNVRELREDPGDHACSFRN
jgi:hypothetical protein